ncbi:MAG: hypothetical protein NC102_03230 [Clostridium sp.]|nr:hypothetical protein [Clostridium sp.]
MYRTAISKCHSLKLCLIDRLENYARIGSRALVRPLSAFEDAGGVPGTLKVEQSRDDGAVKKKISIEMPNVGADMANRLRSLRLGALIAEYVDEAGCIRVSGSPSYPLSLEFVDAGGVVSVTLTGEDTDEDAFLMA